MQTLSQVRDCLPCLILAVLFYYLMGALGITAGAHRLWSHRTYKARLPLRVFLIIGNTMAFQVRSQLCSALALCTYERPQQPDWVITEVQK